MLLISARRPWARDGIIKRDPKQLQTFCHHVANQLTLMDVLVLTFNNIYRCRNKNLERVSDSISTAKHVLRLRLSQTLLKVTVVSLLWQHGLLLLKTLSPHGSYENSMGFQPEMVVLSRGYSWGAKRKTWIVGHIWLTSQQVFIHSISAKDLKWTVGNSFEEDKGCRDPGTQILLDLWWVHPKLKMYQIKTVM